MDSRKFARAILGCLTLAVVAVGGLFLYWVQSLALTPEPFERVDAIVSLAGGRGRLDAGLTLLQEGRAEMLLLSGTHRGVKLQEIFPDRDVHSVPPESVVLLESRSTSTYENALEARAVLLTRRPVESIVLLTSNYHIARARYVFAKVWPSDVRIYLFPVVSDATRPGDWWKSSHGRQVVAIEFVKWCWYRIRF